MTKSVSNIHTDFICGDSCSHTYLKLSDRSQTQFIFDWTYDKVYCKYGSEVWITIVLSSPDVQFLEADNFKKDQFTMFVIDSINKLNNYNYNGVPEALTKLRSIMTTLN